MGSDDLGLADVEASCKASFEPWNQESCSDLRLVYGGLTSRSDVGFAADPDGDRLALVDGAGDAVSEEHTVVLAAQAVAQRGDRVVANVVTTHALEGALPGIEVIRSAVGEMNVVNAVLAHHAVLGGEGSGGIIVPPMNMARDGLAAATLILTLMAQRDAPLKTLVDALPRWQAVKEKLPAPADGSGQLAALMQRWRTAVPTVQAEGPSTLRVGDGEATVRLQWDDQQLTLVVEQPDSRFESRTPVAPLRALLTRLRDRAEPLTIDMTDGLKLSGNGAWLSLRASNTEPIFRLMGEVAER